MARRARKPKAPPLGINGLGADDQRRLLGFVTRIERLLDDRKPIDDDIKAVLAEARLMNFHVGTIRERIRERAMDATKRQQLEDLRDTYRHALGMLADTPLGRASIVRPAPMPQVDIEEAIAERDPRDVTTDQVERAKESLARMGTLASEATEVVTAIVDAATDARPPAGNGRPLNLTIEPEKSAEDLAGEALDGMRALRADTPAPQPEPEEGPAP